MKNFSLTAATIFFIVSLIAYCRIDSAFRNFLTSNLVLDSQTKQSFQGWQNPPVDIFFRVYFFNITNPDGIVERNETITLKELGPYTYKETREKVNVTINNEEGIIKYQEKKSWRFVPEKSEGNLNDTVTHLNIPLLSEYHEITRLGGEEMMYEYLAALVKMENVKLMLTHTVAELMFDGCPDKLLQSAAEMGLQVPEKFGFFYDRNNSVSREYKIRNGAIDLNVYGRMVSYDGMEKLNYWKSESCNRIDQSTTGDLNPPFQSPMPSTIKIFVNDLCRSFPLKFNGSSKSKKIITNRYILPSYAFNYEVDPENQCYCLHDECPESGIFENSVCTNNSTASISFPHFMYAHHKYSKHIKGLEPNPDLHSFYLDVDPALGVVARASAKLQINFKLMKMNLTGLNMTDFMQENEIVVPAFWASTDVEVPEDLYIALHIVQNIIPRLGIMVASIFLFISLILTFYFIVTKLHISQKVSSKPDNQDKKINRQNCKIVEATGFTN